MGSGRFSVWRVWPPCWDTATGGINYAGGNVGIGTTTPSSKLHVKGIDSLGSTIRTERASDDGFGSYIDLKKTRTGGITNDLDWVGTIRFLGGDDTSQEVEYANISSYVTDNTNGTEDGVLKFTTML